MPPEPTVFDLVRALVTGSSDARIISACKLSDEQRAAARRERRLVTLQGGVAIVLEPGTTAPPSTMPPT
jgi:hypothetical protein